MKIMLVWYLTYYTVHAPVPSTEVTIKTEDLNYVGPKSDILSQEIQYQFTPYSCENCT